MKNLSLEMKKLPNNVKPYKRTPIFTEKNIPPGLLKNHSTKKDVWGVIKILQGKLEYTIEDKTTHLLDPDKEGIIEPLVLHHIKAPGAVTFFVEFYI